MTGADMWPVVTGEVESLHEEVVTAYGPYAGLRTAEWLYLARYAEDGGMGRAESYPPRLCRTDAELVDCRAQYPQVADQMEARLRQLVD